MFTCPVSDHPKKVINIWSISVFFDFILIKSRRAGRAGGPVRQFSRLF